MTVNDIYAFLDQKFPFASACSDDNVGLLVGSGDIEVKSVLVTLDLTKAAIEEAERLGANLIITHHPVIFAPLSEIKRDSLVYSVIQKIFR